MMEKRNYSTILSFIKDKITIFAQNSYHKR